MDATLPVLRKKNNYDRVKVSEFEGWLVMSVDLDVLCLVSGDQRGGMTLRSTM